MVLPPWTPTALLLCDFALEEVLDIVYAGQAVSCINFALDRWGTSYTQMGCIANI